jgi:hypothetical protein
MSKMIDANSIQNAVEEAWKLAGADKEIRPGLTMQQFLEFADKNNQRQLKTISNWLLVFDECAAWFSNLACLLMFTLKTNNVVEDDSRDARLHRVLTSLIGNISAQAIAIRRLVLSGLDVQAKQLVRALVEQLDVALLVSKDANALDGFESTVDGPTANAFWHRHLSKGKPRGKVYSRLRERLGEKSYQELLEYFKQEERILGMAIHPSLAASQVASLPGLANLEEQRPFTLGFVGDVTSFSERTLGYSVFYMLFYVLDGGYVPELKENEAIDEDAMKFLVELRKHVLQGQLALMYIFSYVHHNQGNPEFSTPLSERQFDGL